MTVTNSQLLASLAKVEGLVQGMGQLMNLHEQNINRRIDDKFGEVISRLDRQEANISSVAQQAQAAEKTAVAALERSKRVGGISGAGAGGLMAAVFEAIKMMAR